jgi:hypothetical protein
VSLASKLKTSSRAEQLSIIFYVISGVFLLVLLPFASFAPHLGLIGIFSLITAVSVLLKKKWAIWLVAVLFITASVFSLWTIFSIGLSSLIITAGLVAYFAFTLLATVYLGLYRKPSIA